MKVGDDSVMFSQTCYFEIFSSASVCDITFAVENSNWFVLQDEDSEFTLAADFEIGHFFRERIVPRAVLYFTGEAIEDDDNVCMQFAFCLLVST